MVRRSALCLALLLATVGLRAEFPPVLSEAGHRAS